MIERTESTFPVAHQIDEVSTPVTPPSADHAEEWDDGDDEELRAEALRLLPPLAVLLEMAKAHRPPQWWYDDTDKPF